jgi:hypothetical protein
MKPSDVGLTVPKVAARAAPKEVPVTSLRPIWTIPTPPISPNVEVIVAVLIVFGFNPTTVTHPVLLIAANPLLVAVAVQE